MDAFIESFSEFTGKLITVGLLIGGVLLFAGEIRLAALKKASEGSSRLSGFTASMTKTKPPFAYGGQRGTGKNLVKLCDERHLTLSKLAKLSGTKQSTLHGWSTGRAAHNLDDLKKVCEVLKVSVHFILYGTQDPYESAPEISLEKLFKGNFQVTFRRID